MHKRVMVIVEDDDRSLPHGERNIDLPDGIDRRIVLVEGLSEYQANELAQSILYLGHHQLVPAAQRLPKVKEGT